MSFTVVPEETARQLADPGPPEACPYCGQRAFWRNGSYERHRLLLGPCRVQRRQAEAPWDTTAKLPGVVLLDETWLPLEGRQQPVAVVLDTEGQPRDLRRTGPDFDWTAYFQELEARGVHMRRTVRRRLQRMRQGRDRILPTPQDAAVLQGVARPVRELPLWGGQPLLVCCEKAHQGVVQQSPLVLALVEHVMDRWNGLVRCVRDPSVPPARTDWRAGLDASSPGRG